MATVIKPNGEVTAAGENYENIKSAAKAEYKAVKEAAAQTYGNAADAVRERCDAVKEGAREEYDHVKSAAKDAYDNRVDKAAERFGDRMERVKDDYRAVEEGYDSAVGAVKRRKRYVDTALVKDMHANGWEKIKARAEEMYDEAKEFFNDKL